MKCHQCIHSRPIPGDAHLSCAHPAVKGSPDEILSPMMIIVGQRSLAMTKLGVTVNQHGAANGWAMWPMNFDPVWIESCNGFKEKPDMNNLELPL